LHRICLCNFINTNLFTVKCSFGQKAISSTKHLNSLIKLQ